MPCKKIFLAPVAPVQADTDMQLLLAWYDGKLFQDVNTRVLYTIADAEHITQKYSAHNILFLTTSVPATVISLSALRCIDESKQVC